MAGFGINPNFNWAAFGGDTLSDVGYGLTQAPTIWGGLAAGVKRSQDQQPLRDAAARIKAEDAAKQKAIEDQAALRSKYADFFNTHGRPDIAQGIADGIVDPAQAYWDHINPKQASGPAPTSDMQNYEYGLTHPGFVDFQTQRGGAAETSLTPTWGIDSDPNSPTFNKPVLGQLNKAGQFVKTELPAGVQPMDPGALAGTKAGATVDAKTVSNAKASLRGMGQAVEITRKTIDNLRSNKEGMANQFGNTLGIPNQILPAWPGSPRANFLVDLEQATGQAFMQARDALKGAGQVTDYEGRRAEAAYSKMEAASRSGDQTKFLEAVDEFEQAVEAGYAKLQEVASGSVGGQSAPGATSTGVQWSYEP